MPSLPLSDKPFEQMKIKFLMKEEGGVCRIDGLVFIAQKAIPPEFDTILSVRYSTPVTTYGLCNQSFTGVPGQIATLVTNACADDLDCDFNGNGIVFPEDSKDLLDPLPGLPGDSTGLVSPDGNWIAFERNWAGGSPPQGECRSSTLRRGTATCSIRIRKTATLGFRFPGRRGSRTRGGRYQLE